MAVRALPAVSFKDRTKHRRAVENERRGNFISNFFLPSIGKRSNGKNSLNIDARSIHDSGIAIDAGTRVVTVYSSFTKNKNHPLVRIKERRATAANWVKPTDRIRSIFLTGLKTAKIGEKNQPRRETFLDSIFDVSRSEIFDDDGSENVPRGWKKWCSK